METEVLPILLQRPLKLLFVQIWAKFCPFHVRFLAPKLESSCPPRCFPPSLSWPTNCHVGL